MHIENIDDAGLVENIGYQQERPLSQRIIRGLMLAAAGIIVVGAARKARNKVMKGKEKQNL